MSSLFIDKTSFNEDISGWDTSSVTRMDSMFYNADAFNQPIGNWDTSSVKYMSLMFYKADAFNQPIGNWDTSSVKSMYQMFNDADAFNQPIGNWDTSSVTHMTRMFYNAHAFDQNLTTWNFDANPSIEDIFFKDNGLDLLSKYDMCSAYSGFCFTLQEAVSNAISNSNVCVHNNCGIWKDKHISDFNTTGITDMSNMFKEKYTFNQDLSKWDTSAVTNMYRMFYLAKQFDKPLSWDFRSLDVSSTQSGLWYTFGISGAQRLNFIGSYFNIDTMTYADSTWMNNNRYSHAQYDYRNRPDPIRPCPTTQTCSHLPDPWLYVKGIGECECQCEGSGCCGQNEYLNGDTCEACPALKGVDKDYHADTACTCLSPLVDDGSGNCVPPDIHEIDAYNNGVPEARCPGGYRQLTLQECQAEAGSNSFSSENNNEKITGCSKAPDGTFYLYNEYLQNTDNNGFGYEGFIALCKYKNITFTLAESVAYALENEGICSSVLCGMLYGRTIENFDVSGVTDMSFAFADTTFNGDLSAWDTSSVTNMDGMFRNAVNFDANIGNWDTSKVTSMKHIFENVKSVDASVATWNVSSRVCSI
jgi:surface protein